MNILEIITLSPTETSVLFAIEYQVGDRHVKSTQSNISSELRGWLDEWKNSVESGLELEQEKLFSMTSTKSEIVDYLKSLTLLKRSAIIFEASLFKPYFNLNKRKFSGIQKIVYKEAMYKNFETVAAAVLSEICEETKVDYSCLLKAKAAYEIALRDLPANRRFKRIAIAIAAGAALAITAGIFAPILGTVIGGLLGLSGAAATSAGLALIGGGAIAAGGLGIAGGTTFIICGGALLGATFGNKMGRAILTEDKFLTVSAAKIEGFIRGFLSSDEQKAAAKSVVAKYEEHIESIKNQVEKSNDEEKKRLELSREILRRACESLRNIYL